MKYWNVHNEKNMEKQEKTKGRVELFEQQGSTEDTAHEHLAWVC